MVEDAVVEDAVVEDAVVEDAVVEDVDLPSGPPAGGPAVGYDPDAGFLIDFEGDPGDTPAPGPQAPACPVAESPAARPAAPRAEARRSFVGTVRMLRRHAWLVVALTALGLGAGALAPTWEVHRPHRTGAGPSGAPPAGPGLPLGLALGGLAGLLAGLGLAVVRYRTDGTVRTPDDLRDHGFVVFGTVPDVTAALRGGRQEVEGARVHPALVTLTRPFAPEAEAFRHLHARLCSGAQAPQVVIVGAPEAHVGTSTVAANLAVSAAQAGRRVLLVDADLRRPAVGALFGLGALPPLGEGPEGSNLVYWSTTVPGLFAMTPRDVANRPDQTWAPHRVGALLRNLRSAFDLVVVDTPAALASADATLLAPHADAALLVAEAGETSLDALAHVAGVLDGVGLTRVRAVLNRFDARPAAGARSTAGVRQAAPGR